MPRARAILAVLLTVIWCSAVTHVELEAIGWILDHAHHHPHTGEHAHDVPGSIGDHHEQVFARDTAKDAQMRVAVSGVLWFSLVGLLAVLGVAARHRAADDEAIAVRRRGDLPLAQVWQFMWRCAPESLAPPALG